MKYERILESIKKRDPAAKSILSIIITYPGVKAVLLYRIANFFHIAGFHLIAKLYLKLPDFLQVLKFILEQLVKIYSSIMAWVLLLEKHQR